MVPVVRTEVDEIPGHILWFFVAWLVLISVYDNNRHAVTVAVVDGSNDMNFQR
jgi:hypothetical protein